MSDKPKPSAQIKPSGPAKAAQQPTLEQLKQLTANPLLMLPAEWRTPVWKFHTYYVTLMREQICLCSRIRHWIDQGLTLQQFQRVAARLTRPERSARFAFESELDAAISSLVAEEMRSADERRVLEQVTDGRTPEEKDKVAKRLKEMLESWKSQSS